MSTLLHPTSKPARALNVAVDVPNSMRVNTALRYGIVADVYLPKVGGGRALFLVPVRSIEPNIVLGPRDPEITQWLISNGWESALLALENRWEELRESGELITNAGRRLSDAELRIEGQRRENPETKGVFEELAELIIEAVEDDPNSGLYDAATKAAKDAEETALRAKWVGAGVIGVILGVVVAKAISKS